MRGCCLNNFHTINMQNVLFFIFRLYGGGAERVVSNLSMAFSEQYNIKVAVYDNQEKVYPYQGELIRIKLPFSDDPTRNSWWQRLARLAILLYKVRKLKKQHQIDVTVSFAEQANIVNILTKGKRRTVISVRTLLSQELASTRKMKILDRFIKPLYNRAQQVIVPSQLVARDLRDHFGVKPGRLKVIYNYIEQERINAMAAEAIEDPFLRSLFDQPVLLNVGRITPAKGQWLLFEVMKRVKPLHPDWKLVIIGESETEGGLKTRLLGFAERLGLKLYDSAAAQPPSLEYDIYLLGFDANPFRFMRHSRALVFPSVFEGFPNTVLEAMQCGLPVVVADCLSGPREILAPGSDPADRAVTEEMADSGILCPALPAADIDMPIPEWITEAWLRAIDRVMHDNDLRSRFIRQGCQRVLDFNKTIILDEWRKSINGSY
jgi:glycosyltransferase involved in cell wall biosynthesis